MEPNQFDRDGCAQRGMSAQARFEEIARSRNIPVVHATAQQDMNEHWDVRITLDGAPLRVDVKGMRKIRRSDALVQDTWTWIELHGVREHDLGSLYGSKAELIAFEKKDVFVLVERNALIDLIARMVDTTQIVHRPEDAQYKVYSRPGRHDKITLVELRKLEEIARCIWEKVDLAQATSHH